jgi:hypothetical protein
VDTVASSARTGNDLRIRRLSQRDRGRSGTSRRVELITRLRDRGDVSSPESNGGTLLGGPRHRHGKSMTGEERQRWGRIGGLTAHSRHSPVEMTAGARRGFRERFRRLVDPSVSWRPRNASYGPNERCAPTC